MADAVSLSKELIDQAKLSAKRSNSTSDEQIEHWATIGKRVENNPDLPYEFIKGVLLSLEQMNDGQLEPYKFSKE